MAWHARKDFVVEWGGGQKWKDYMESCGHKLGVKFVRLGVILGLGCFLAKNVDVRQQYLQKVREMCGIGT